MKAADSYESVLRGVSQQVPQDRTSGQHAEQVNMLSDPVNGLTRRHGSMFQAELILAGCTPGQMESYRQDTDNWRSLEWDTTGNEYVVLYRVGPRPVTANPLPAFVVYNKTTKQFLNVVRNPTDTALDLLESGGVSAITPVGRYLFACAHQVPVSGTSTEVWNTPTNLDRAVLWVRGGAFSRTFTVTATRTDGTRTVFTYTTPPSSFQGVLDTSDIPSSASDYTKQVNDRVNAYNASVTQWIGTSTQAVQPANIAESLRVAAVAAGLNATRLGSHLHFTGVVSIDADDGGNGELIRGVADEVASVDAVSVIHHVGKVVKVRSRNAAEAFYLKAVPRDRNVTTGYTEVTWVEGAGVEHSITGGFFYATVSGNNFFVASSASLLNAITPGSHPTFSVSTAGDNDSAPRPFFVGRKVTYLSAFQNRLLVGSGGVLAVSKTDDYLNFFRSTVLTLPASDPFEMLPQGSEDDELVSSTLYDQDIVVFGRRRQYVISGSIALTPTSANMAVMSSYENSAECPPVAAGGFIFYAKRGERFSSLFQIQPGQNENSPESFPASSQIDSYLQGSATEMTVLTGSPSILFMRTSGARNSLYTFAYLDKPDGRKMDAWSRWDFNTALGIVIGMNVVTDGVATFSLRAAGNSVAVVADLCPTTTGLSDRPYLDSQRSWAQVQAGTTSLTPSAGEQYAAAFTAASERRFTGTLLPSVQNLLTRYPSEPGLVVGATYESFVEPTNPYMRDGNGKAILSGRLTITKFTIAFRNSVGFDWDLLYRDQLVSSVTFNGRILGAPENVVGVEPLASGQYVVPVGRETRQFRIVLKARRWYPFTLTAIEWTGQFFNRVQRF